MNRFGLLFCLLLLAVSAAPADARTWTDRSGRVMEATFVRVLGGNVVLKLRSGKIASVPLAALIEEDQNFIREQAGQVKNAIKSLRVWTDVGGKQSSAKMSHVRDGVVFLRTDRGVVQAQFTRLSVGDRLFLRQHLPARDLPPPEPDEQLPEARPWTDRKGNRVVAQFERVVGANVLLATAGGTLVTRFHELTPEDQDFLRRHLNSQGVAHDLPGGRKPRPEGPEPAPTDLFDLAAAPEDKPPVQPADPASIPHPGETPADEAGSADDVRVASIPPRPRPAVRPRLPIRPPRPTTPPTGPGTAKPTPTPEKDVSIAFSRPNYARTCSSCGDSLPVDVALGDECPHCQVKLTAENMMDGSRRTAEGEVNARGWWEIAGLGLLIGLAVIGFGVVLRFLLVGSSA